MNKENENLEIINPIEDEILENVTGGTTYYIHYRRKCTKCGHIYEIEEVTGLEKTPCCNSYFKFVKKIEKR